MYVAKTFDVQPKLQHHLLGLAPIALAIANRVNYINFWALAKPNSLLFSSRTRLILSHVVGRFAWLALWTGYFVSSMLARRCQFFWSLARVPPAVNNLAKRWVTDKLKALDLRITHLRCWIKCALVIQLTEASVWLVNLFIQPGMSLEMMIIFIWSIIAQEGRLIQEFCHNSI